jgi:hypothetical protein
MGARILGTELVADGKRHMQDSVKFSRFATAQVPYYGEPGSCFCQPARLGLDLGYDSLSNPCEAG